MTFAIERLKSMAHKSRIIRFSHAKHALVCIIYINKPVFTKLFSSTLDLSDNLGLLSAGAYFAISLFPS